MIRRRTVAAAVALTLLSGCGAEPAATTPPVAVVGPFVPSLVGLALDSADDRLQAAGFGQAGASDALRDRSPIVRSDWQVCAQQPGPGPARLGTVVAVMIVQRAETCPGAAAGTTSAVTPTTAPTPTVAPTRRPRVPRSTSLPTPTPTTAPDRSDPPGPTVTAGTPCRIAGAAGVTRWGTPVVCRPGGDGRNRWRRS